MSTLMVNATDPRAVPAAVRALARSGELDHHTAGMAAGYAQANLAILPRALAYEFLLFCQRNPKPCPLLDVTDAGSPEPRLVAPGADLRTDLPRYRVYRHGVLVDEPTDIVRLWRDDLVAFLLGCSYTFEAPMVEAGIAVRHLDCGRNVPMYRTNRACVPAGRIAGPLVVSFRAIPATQVARAVQVTSRFPAVHGAPVHIGDPESLGIRDLASPDWGDPPVIEPGDVPVFWACGVTPQAVAMTIKPELMITHSPGYMFVTDVPIASLAVG
ncbi:MAG TPA: putative hydro-lyase [Thermomicrobiaceae bacterium]|nr:putative hydro-lyase [Thermomicrobiaceae bacterium]